MPLLTDKKYVKQVPFLTDLPVEILELIIQYLPKASLLSLRLTSHFISQIATRALFPLLVLQITYQSKSYLHTAIESHRHNLICNLLKAKAPPNSRGVNHCSPLHTAVRTNCIVCVRIFLRYGAEVDGEDKFGWTPLQLAARFGKEGIVRELLREGAAVNHKGFHGWTALYYARREGYKSVEGFLRKAGAKEDVPETSEGVRMRKQGGWGQWSPW